MNAITNQQAAADIEVKLPKRILAEVIVNFLGKREQLAFSKQTFFKVSLNDLAQFHYLLDQKVRKEAFTDLIFFEAAVVYNDNTTRKLSTIESLEQFHETRNVVPLSVTLRWHSVFRFPEASTLETQKVSLTFRRTDSAIDGVVDLMIEHTNQAWANEVLALMDGQIRRVSRDLGNWEKFWLEGSPLVEFRSLSLPLLVGVALLTMAFKRLDTHSSSSTEYSWPESQAMEAVYPYLLDPGNRSDPHPELCVPER